MCICQTELIAVEPSTSSGEQTAPTIPNPQSKSSHFRTPTSHFRTPTSALPLPTSAFPLPTSALPLPHSHFRIPTSALPLPHSHLRIPTSAFPLPHSHFPIPFTLPPGSKTCAPSGFLIQRAIYSDRPGQSWFLRPDRETLNYFQWRKCWPARE